MPLTCLHFCEGAAGNVTALGLKPSGKLFLCQLFLFPYCADPLTYGPVIGMIQADTSHPHLYKCNFELILAQICAIIAPIQVQL